MTMWLATVTTDDGVEVLSVHETREGARMACPSHGEPRALTTDVCARLCAAGIMVDESGQGPDEIKACDVLPLDAFDA